MYMAFNADHDHYVMKNRMLARSVDLDKKDKRLEKKGSVNAADKPASCFTCKDKSKCPEFRAKRGGGSSGVVSFGGNETMICDKYVPAPEDQKKGMNKKQIKSLMKSFKRGF